MSYTSSEEIKEAFSEADLIQLASEVTTLDAAALLAIAAAITSADAEIDAHLLKIYTLPLSPEPAILKTLSTELSICNLYKKRKIFNEDYERRYKYAHDILDKISSGEIVISELEDDDDEYIPAFLRFTSDTVRGF